MRAKAITELTEPALEVSTLAAPETMPIDLVATYFLPLYNECPCHALHIEKYKTTYAA